MNYKAENFRNQPPVANQLSNSDCVKISRDLKFSLKGMMNFLIGASNCLQVMHFTQSYVASKLGITREHTNRLMAKARKLGLVFSEYRHMTSCVYTINPAFQNLDVRNSLKDLYVSCKYLPLSILMSLGDEMKSLNSMIGVNQFNQKQYIEEIVAKENISLNKDYNNNSLSISYPTSLYTENSNARKAPPGATSSRTGDIKSTGKRPNSHIKGLNLTEAGCIKLLAYPPGAIEAALQALRQHKGEIRDPFVFFSKLCLNYCRDNDIHVDWGICFNELRRKGYEKSAVGIDSKNPYLYYTPEEIKAVTPPKAPSKPLYPDAVAPAKREFDKLDEAQRAEAALRAMPDTGIHGLNDIFADIFKCIIRDGQETLR